VPQQVPKGKKGKKRKAEEDDLDAEEDLAAAAASRGIPVVNGQPLMCFMAPHLVSCCLAYDEGDIRSAGLGRASSCAVTTSACFPAQLASTAEYMHRQCRCVSTVTCLPHGLPFIVLQAEVPVDEVPDDLAAATQLNIHLVVGST
jgi:hypothetical protein